MRNDLEACIIVAGALAVAITIIHVILLYVIGVFKK
jgi:hypothetical protein